MFSLFPSPVYPSTNFQNIILHYSNRSRERSWEFRGHTQLMTWLRREASEGGGCAGSSRKGRIGVSPGRSRGSPGLGPLAARTHQRSGETGARPGLQLALATLALAVQELLRDLALVAAGHQPVGTQFSLTPRPALNATGPTGWEVAQVVVIRAVIELLLGAHRRPHVGWRWLGSRLDSGNGRVHRAGSPARAGARVSGGPRPALRLASPEQGGA